MPKTTRERLERCDEIAEDLETTLRSVREKLKKAINMVGNDEKIDYVDMLTDMIIDRLLKAGAKVLDAGFTTNEAIRELKYHNEKAKAKANP